MGGARGWRGEGTRESKEDGGALYSFFFSDWQFNELRKTSYSFSYNATCRFLDDNNFLSIISTYLEGEGGEEGGRRKEEGGGRREGRKEEGGRRKEEGGGKREGGRETEEQGRDKGGIREG
jgi:hypothetical protein